MEKPNNYASLKGHARRKINRALNKALLIDLMKHAMYTAAPGSAERNKLYTKLLKMNAW